ncbi:MAG: Hpt domain-containing protein [Candidatus Omnitrophica bacterium]|nr:Hpt domain-containing protein [Candidatus Omnitrophota bacterium]
MDYRDKLQRQAILSALGGISEDIYLELIGLFRQQTREQLAQAAAALAANNLALIGTIVHSIKGAAANLRLQALVEPAAALERLAKDGSDPAAIPQLFAQLRDAFAALEDDFSGGG